MRYNIIIVYEIKLLLHIMYVFITNSSDSKMHNYSYRHYSYGPSAKSVLLMYVNSYKWKN